MKQHTKTLGQVFLHDQNIIQKIIAFASPSPHIPLIEIGCGKGILTQALAALGHPLHVIEIDNRWLTTVKALNLPNTTFSKQDALTVDFSSHPRSAIIANIPYQITSPLIEHFSTHKNQFESITIMIQHEVAQRLLAKNNTKAFGAFTLFSNYHFDIRKGFRVSRHCFSPEPNVDSMVIKLTPKKNALSDNDTQRFFAMTRSFFWGRRKTMLNCLMNSPYCHCSPDIQENHALTHALKQRGEALNLENHLALFEQVKPYIQLNCID